MTHTRTSQFTVD